MSYFIIQILSEDINLRTQGFQRIQESISLKVFRSKNPFLVPGF